MPATQHTLASFDAVAASKKRGLPYARDQTQEAYPHPSQAPEVLSGVGGPFYISGPRPARLFPTAIHEFRKGKYATTGGDRGFMTVFEYDVRGHTMMIDVDTSFVRFTSITQAIGKNKVNFGRLVRTCPALDPHITKLKGGYLSIQGTWLPYDLAKELSRRIAWEIRDHLVPLFGYDFPSTCLRPDSEGFGQLAIGMSQKRARKRHNNGGPHQTSCYGPSLPISVVDGRTIERDFDSKVGGLSQSYQPQPASSYHYGKAAESERYPWYSGQSLASNTTSTNVASMMWPSSSTMGVTNSSSLPPLYPSGLAGLGSPIMSSPPSSNASTMSSAQSAAMHGLMVPPTVPSSTFGNGSGEGGIFDMHHTALADTKEEGVGDSRSYEGFGASQTYSTDAGANAQLSAWTDSARTSAPASSSPTPPPAGSHASSFQFGQWQQ